MIIFIKKIKSKEGINSFDNEKIKKEIPKGYKASSNEPAITMTGHHMMIAYKCEKITTEAPKPKEKTKQKPKSKKSTAAKKA